MAFTRAQKLSIFRKVALSMWGSGGDPSVYGFLEIDVTDTEFKASPLPVVIKALSEVMKNHKELNSILRFGRLYYRKNLNISVMVNIPNGERNDLSIATLENVDRMTLEQIEEKVTRSSKLIRKEKDPHLGFALKLVNSLPWFVTKFFLKLYEFIAYDLHIHLKPLRLPKAPFGSVIVTNVGSLGIKKALVPLVPFSRAAMLMSVGEINKEPRVINDQIQIRKIMHVGCTFDHRFFDGSHAAAMIRDFEHYVKKGS